MLPNLKGIEMGNCYRIFIGGRLFAIVHTELQALFLISGMNTTEEVRIELAYVEGIGF